MKQGSEALSVTSDPIRGDREVRTGAGQTSETNAFSKYACFYLHLQSPKNAGQSVEILIPDGETP